MILWELLKACSLINLFIDSLDFYDSSTQIYVSEYFWSSHKPIPLLSSISFCHFITNGKYTLVSTLCDCIVSEFFGQNRGLELETP